MKRYKILSPSLYVLLLLVIFYDNSSDLNLGLLVLALAGIFGWTFYKIKFNYTFKKIENNPNSEVRLIEGNQEYDYNIAFKLCSTAGSILLAFSLGYEIYGGLLITALLFISPVFFVSPFIKLKPLKVFYARNIHENQNSLSPEQIKYLNSQARKLGLKKFLINHDQLSLLSIKGNLWIILFLLPTLLFVVLGVDMFYDDGRKIISAGVFLLGVFGTLYLVRLLVRNLKKDSNLLEVKRTGEEINLPYDIFEKKLPRSNHIRKSKINKIVFKSKLEYKEKFKKSTGYSPTYPYYTYQVLLKVGGKYKVAFELDNWNKPSFDNKKFTFLIGLDISEKLNLKYSLSEDSDT